jgi:hypothetical protein
VVDRSPGGDRIVTNSLQPGSFDFLKKTIGKYGESHPSLFSIVYVLSQSVPMGDPLSLKSLADVGAGLWLAGFNGNSVLTRELGE